jgi:hypothetical protein
MTAEGGADRGCRDLHPEAQQFSLDALVTPPGILLGQADDRWTFTAERVQRRGRSAADCLAEEGEVEFEPGANPAHGVGDDEAAALAVGELAGEV